MNLTKCISLLWISTYSIGRPFILNISKMEQNFTIRHKDFCFIHRVLYRGFSVGASPKTPCIRDHTCSSRGKSSLWNMWSSIFDNIIIELVKKIIRQRFVNTGPRALNGRYNTIVGDTITCAYSYALLGITPTTR